MDEANGGAGRTPADSARRVKEAATSAFDTSKDAVGRTVEKGAEQTRTSIGAVASSLHRVADDVEGENAWVGSALHKSAQSLEKAADALSGGDLNSMLEGVSGFARRQPAIFLGASVALGFALARVGKTAIETAADGDQTSGAYPRSSGGGGYTSGV